MGYAYANNGQSFRVWNDPSTLAAGEIYFADMPTSDELTAAFPGYAAATAAATLQQQAQALLSAGLTITSTGTSSLDGTYPTSPTAQQQVNAEITSILLNGTFADGTTPLPWPDVSGAAHEFTVEQFKAFASAFAGFVSGCVKCINGFASSLPAASATIP